MVQIIVVVFGLVYFGMFLGRIPGLQIDRTGIALLGAIALVALGVFSLDEAAASVDLPTLTLLFAFMVISAQLRLGGFYTWVINAIARLNVSAPQLLAVIIAVAAALSAVFTNDVVCLAVAPVLIHVCIKKHFNPLPFLIALASAANIGSAATLIGNPQNILIGQMLRLPFGGYMQTAALPVLLGLAATWGILAFQFRGQWDVFPENIRVPDDERQVNLWQMSKGLGVAAILFVSFLFLTDGREIISLAMAGLLLSSRRMHSRDMLNLVDWQLLVLFGGLFVVNRAFQTTGMPAEIVAALTRAGIDLSVPGWMFGITVLLSNAVSNVPAVMLLLPFANSIQAGVVMAVASTLAGNLLIIGSIANIIVVDSAARAGIPISWRTHAKSGVPIALSTLLISTLLLA